ncbi:hypothetical protein [Guptibacillus hwajinpoensis]|uniref:hypothetical protein n=1 Tax=Guptibacillus hwajinpoensis TaxID=208199 RepID=UPI00384CF997
MKSHNEHSLPKELREQLDQYTVNVPHLTFKKKKSERIADFIATPVQNPLERHAITPGLLLKIQLAPIGLTIGFSAGLILFM